MNHLQQEPRVLLVCNNLSLCARLKKTSAKNPFYQALELSNFHADDTDEVAKSADDAGTFMMDLLKFKKQAPVPAMSQVIDQLSRNSEMIDTTQQPLMDIPEQRHLKETATAKKVELVKTLMKKYNRTDEEELLKEIMRREDPQDIVNFRVLYTGPMIKTIQQQAICEMRIENDLKGYTYIDKFVEECPSPVDVMTVEETAQVHLQWCQEQGIDAGDFLMKMYSVLAKTYPKINCFMLQGQSNDGKTFWTLPLLCFPDMVGQTIQSQDFAFQRCLNKEIIQIPEMSLSKPEQVEETKKIFEGLPTTVNIKIKEPRVLERTPVILTCNSLPWKFFNEEQHAFLNRMFSYTNLHRSSLLEGRKAPNPKYFRRVFEFIRDEVTTLPEYPCLPDDDVMWKMYTDMTGSFIQSIIRMKDIDLSHILESETLKSMYLKVPDEIALPRHNMLGWRATERLSCSHEDLLSEIYTWVYWLTKHGSDDYYFRSMYNQMMLYSGFTDGEYDAELDFDYGDYVSFRSGYSHIKRMLIKMRTWPTEVDERSSLPDRMRLILRETLEKIGNYISAFLKENREKCVALKQAWDACESTVPTAEFTVPTAESFIAGVKRTSTPHSSLDAVDGPRIKKILKKFNASLPAFNVSCTSSAVEVEPEVEVVPEDELSPDSSLIAHHMSGNQQCVEDLMNTEEMYNLVTEMEEEAETVSPTSTTIL